VAQEQPSSSAGRAWDATACLKSHAEKMLTAGR
jgi:hypothetical protein